MFLAERFGLSLAQPAHRARSHAAWQVTRRQPGTPRARDRPTSRSAPWCALHRTTFDTLLPFPALRMGWGLDHHWGAIARRRGWRAGVIDATPIRHGMRRIAVAYDRSDAIAEGGSSWRDRPYLTAAEAQRTLATHRHWT